MGTISLKDLNLGPFMNLKLYSLSSLSLLLPCSPYLCTLFTIRTPEEEGRKELGHVLTKQKEEERKPVPSTGELWEERAHVFLFVLIGQSWGGIVGW